jgi:TrmH family RNA methyltransferase
VLIIGNEGNGISEDTLLLSTHRITIPMKGKAESLNASAAATVLIWEFMKDR